MRTPCREALPAVSACRRVRACRATFTALLAGFAAAHAWGGVSFPAERLQIIAVIDNRDELHISYRAATWVHKSGAQPTGVQEQMAQFQWFVAEHPDYVPEEAPTRTPAAQRSPG